LVLASLVSTGYKEGHKTHKVGITAPKYAEVPNRSYRLHIRAERVSAFHFNITPPYQKQAVQQSHIMSVKQSAIRLYSD